MQIRMCILKFCHFDKSSVRTYVFGYDSYPPEHFEFREMSLNDRVFFVCDSLDTGSAKVDNQKQNKMSALILLYSLSLVHTIQAKSSSDLDNVAITCMY